MPRFLLQSSAQASPRCRLCDVSPLLNLLPDAAQTEQSDKHIAERQESGALIPKQQRMRRDEVDQEEKLRRAPKKGQNTAPDPG